MFFLSSHKNIFRIKCSLYVENVCYRNSILIKYKIRIWENQNAFDIEFPVNKSGALNML